LIYLTVSVCLTSEYIYSLFIILHLLSCFLIGPFFFLLNFLSSILKYYIFNTPTKCTYTMKFKYYYLFYYMFRCSLRHHQGEGFVCSELLLYFVIT
jgi:hypothetical protein